MTTETNKIINKYISIFGNHSEFALSTEDTEELCSALIEVRETIRTIDSACDECSKNKDREIDSYRSVAEEFQDKLEKAEAFIIHNLIDKGTAEQYLLDLLVYKTKENE